MKKISLILSLCSALYCSGQKIMLFDNIDFDSSYQVIGLVQGHGKPIDSLERLWFFIENPVEMQRMQREWKFRDPVASLGHEEADVDIFVIQGKRPIANSALIYPKQGIINVKNCWYRFDTSWLVSLHAAYPLKYRSEQMTFDTYNQYAAYGNSIVNDSNLLFFFEPSLRFEGKFSVYAKRTGDPASPVFVLRDITNECRALAADGRFSVGQPLNDSYNLSRRDSVRIEVNGPRALYEKYNVKHRSKGPWEPTKIQITLFWRRT